MGPGKSRKGSTSRPDFTKKSTPRVFTQVPQARPKVEDEDPEEPPEPEVTVPVPVGFSPEFSPIKGETPQTESLVTQETPEEHKREPSTQPAEKEVHPIAYLLNLSNEEKKCATQRGVPLSESPQKLKMD